MRIEWPILVLLALAGLLAWFVALVVTPAAGAWARRRGIVSHVTGRSSHTVPTPRLGGVGLAAGFLAGSALILLALAMREDPALGYSLSLVGWVAMGWALMFLVGLLDDLLDLPPLAKLLLMSAGAVAPIMADGLRFAPSLGGLLPAGADRMLGAALAIGWILFFTNGFNFMDGMDGFAASFARVAAFYLFVAVAVGTPSAEPFHGARAEWLLVPMLAAAATGFLRWNRPPAKIFMGDAGSLSTGYLLAVFALLAERDALGTSLDVATPLAILMPFVFDVVLTLVRRARRGENLLRAHREHLYQRLMQTGLSHGEVLVMNVWRFHLCGFVALAGALLQGDQHYRAPLIALIGVLFVMIRYWRLTLRRERAAASASAP